MEISLRRERLTSYLKKALSKFFTENADKTGLVCVSEVVLSEDLRRASVFIESLDEDKVDMNRINQNSKLVTEYLKNFFETKFLPRVFFIEK
ncbi:MAG: ribosome-binding factor A [Candidatus Berkelbacteria bacterium]|nr:ribosome-binding factor A [Candidatus Berkelbacteria bacterium]